MDWKEVRSEAAGGCTGLRMGCGEAMPEVVGMAGALQEMGCAEEVVMVAVVREVAVMAEEVGVALVAAAAVGALVVAEG